LTTWVAANPEFSRPKPFDGFDAGVRPGILGAVAEDESTASADAFRIGAKRFHRFV